jgi:uncharacterized protein YjbI with pentapeptide repeats
MSVKKDDDRSMERLLVRYNPFDMSDMPLCGGKFCGHNFKDFIFRRANVSGAIFNYSSFFGAILDNIDAANCQFKCVDFTGAVCSHGDFKNCDFTGAIFSQAKFENCDFRGARFDRNYMSDAGFKSCNFDGVIIVSGA